MEPRPDPDAFHRLRDGWQGASEAEWQEACGREAVIRSLIESGPVSHARADLAAEDLGISRALKLPTCLSVSASSPNFLAFAIPPRTSAT
jgi:hypothetical protein